MGIKRTYKCKKCGYTALVSGGPDVGMLVRTDTFVCLKCKELVDVAVGYTPNSPLKIANRGKCPICNSKKHLAKWDTQLRPCPKCGEKLEEIPGKEVLWD